MKHFPIVLTCLLGAASAHAQSGAQVVAESELQTLAEQLQLVMVDTTYLTTLENLDDGSFANTSSPHQFINDGGGALVIERTAGVFRSSRLDLVNRPFGLEWTGPYVVFQPGRVDGPSSDYDPYTPTDPWGQPYRLYTPLGLVDPIAEAVTLDDYGDEFGVYTVVSYGQDRQPMTADDLTRSLGVGGITQPVISSVRIEASSERRSGWTVAIRGYFFGETAGSVSIGGEEFAGSVDWSPQEITFEVPELPAEGAEFSVQRPTGNPLTFEGYILESPPAAVEDWLILD